MAATTHRAFFGDAERDFALTLPMIDELQRLTGAGILALARSILNHDCGVAEIHQTIRLALIGAGTDPEDAAALIKAYVEPRPLAVAWALAVEIINAALYGTEPEPAKEAA